MKLLLSRLAPTLAVIAALALPSRAQCLTPDNLDNSVVCGAAQTKVPQRSFQQTARAICWNNCNVGSTGTYTALWGALNPMNANNAGMPPSCAWYQTRVRLFSGAQLAWDGQLFAAYSRTWLEAPNAAGNVIQVWRYLVNGDLRLVNSSVATPCGAPSCVAPNGNVMRFTGYVDYAYDCSTLLTQRAWMLHHGCDAVDHVTGYPRAGTYHPGVSYTFVGPAAGFVPGAGATLEAGGAAVESLRKWDATVLPARCGAEEPLLTASIGANAMVCLCGSGPSNWFEGTLFAAGAWGTVVSPFPGSDPFRSFPVGQWTNPNVFPGVEELRWNSNEAQFVECTGVGRQEYYFGVTTAGGWQAYSFNASTPPAPLPQTFVDQSNSVVLPANTATRNRPYRSDHLLNLNL